jgi:hypothetical protein
MYPKILHPAPRIRLIRRSWRKAGQEGKRVVRQKYRATETRGLGGSRGPRPAFLWLRLGATFGPQNWPVARYRIKNFHVPFFNINLNLFSTIHNG